jgi:16S rRNA (guanine1516-N2)-methyltransferase
LLPVVVLAREEDFFEKANVLAQTLKLPIVSQVSAPSFCLNFMAEGLELCLVEESNEISRGISVDFLSGPMQALMKSARRSQPLGRAIGSATTVIDATAGLGKDAFFLFALGLNVLSIEKSPVIFSLLRDGYERAIKDSNVGPHLNQRLKFIKADSVEYLTKLKDEESPDVIYLDPMYPDLKKSALPKKEMQIFRRFMTDASNDLELFNVARLKAKKRVVVKRPLAAKPLREPVSMSFHGKMVRYDSYLKR